MSSPDRLVVTLRTAAHDLVDGCSIRDLETTLTRIVLTAVATVPGADAGGISMTEDGRTSSRSPTTETISKLDRLQSELHEGPCIDAMEHAPDDGVVTAEDLAGPDASRWPHFAPAAVEAGYCSVLSTQLVGVGDTRAALNLYAGRPHTFDDAARLTAGLFGLQAALLLHGSRQASDLQRTIDTRDVIGQATGMLMERFAVDGEEAFRMLVRSSRDTETELVDVAAWLTSEAVERRRARAPRSHRRGHPASTRSAGGGGARGGLGDERGRAR